MNIKEFQKLGGIVEYDIPQIVTFRLSKDESSQFIDDAIVDTDYFDDVQNFRLFFDNWEIGDGYGFNCTEDIEDWLSNVNIDDLEDGFYNL